MSIRILVADDHNLIRDGLRSLFRNTELEITGEATTGREALQLFTENDYDAVILDVRFRGDPDEPISAYGLLLLPRMKMIKPEIPVLMFSAFDNPTYVAKSVSLGASGYILKTSGCDELVAKVRAAAGGESTFTREEMRRVAGALSTPRILANLEVALTQREHEVLNGLVKGMSNKEIARSLDIGYETVKEHVQHILRKAGVTDRTQAAIWAVRKGVA